MKKFLFLVPMILLVAAACGNQQLKPQSNIQPQQNQPPAKTTDETANWKTYLNNRVGYEFEYPNTGLNLDLNETIKYPDSKTKNQDLVQFAKDSITYGVRTYVGTSNPSVQDWIQKGNSSTGQDPNNYEIKTVGGQVAYSAIGIAVTNIFYKGNVYVIDAHSGISPSVNNDPIYNHILSTFKFTDAISDWKTYTNTKYKYSISVPASAEVNTDLTNINLGSSANIQINAYQNNTTNDALQKPNLSQYVEKNISGNKTYQLRGIGSAKAFFIDTLFYGLDSNYEIVFSDETGKSKETLADQILSTFKFTGVADATVITNEKAMGYIKSVYEKNGKEYLEIDYVQWLTGKEALQAAIEDKKCFKGEDVAKLSKELEGYDITNGSGKFGECAPNGFYIRNQNTQIRTIEILKDAEIAMQTYASGKCYVEPNEKVSHAVFKSFWGSNPICSHLKSLPYNIEIQKSIITKITEQYIP